MQLFFASTFIHTFNEGNEHWSEACRYVRKLLLMHKILSLKI